MDAMLEVTNLRVSYGGVLALSDVSISLTQVGRDHALVARHLGRCAVGDLAAVVEHDERVIAAYLGE